MNVRLSRVHCTLTEVTIHMDKQFKNYVEIAPVLGPYSRAVKAGNLFFIAGCTASGSASEDGSLSDQLREVLNRTKMFLEAEGQSVKDIIKLTTFVTDINEWENNSEAIGKIFKEMFSGTYPVNTLIGGVSLILPSLKVEIEAIAIF